MITVHAQISAQAQVKHNFSKHHLWAAQYFSDRSFEIEQDTVPKDDDQRIINIHRSYIIGAIIFTVAGLESSINELYLEAIDNNQHTLSGLDRKAIEILGEVWKEIETYSSLSKYQTALILTGFKQFGKGQQPYQDTDTLMKLRNALVHYKPEWDSELDVHRKLKARLEPKSFPLNPFSSKNSLWFPHRCLGSGCAKWAVNAGETFLTEFCKRMGIPNRLPS